jgi:pimeloyl-ACP methyl ester carboxylesterase
MWDGLKPSLSKNYQFISIDLPGFGGSALPSKTSTMEAMARDIIATLDAAEVKDKFVASGVSMGGYVLLQLARLFPERLRGLALISTRSSADTPEGREKRFRTIELVEKPGGIDVLAEKMMPQLFGATSLSSKLPVIEQVKGWIKGANPAAVCAALRGMAERPDSTSLLKSIAVPTLVLSGTEDIFIPTSEMEAMAKGISGSEFHAIPQAGHLIPLETPAIYVDKFAHFLKRRVL